MAPIKALVLGESGSGKTGALASLLNAGYNVRVLDLDNGMDALKSLVTDPKSTYSKDCITRLDYVSLTEPMRVVSGRIVPAKATVWNRTIGLLENWKQTPELVASNNAPRAVEYGKVSTWGEQDVLVLDTLSTLGTAAFNFTLQMNGRLGTGSTGYEYQRDVGSAQASLISFLEMLYDTSVRCNVVINTHITHAKEDGTNPKPEEKDVELFGFPSSIGKAILKKTGIYFNTTLLVKRQGFSSKIYTSHQPRIGLKTAAPLNVARDYSIETGLAQYFAAVRGEKK